LTGRLATTTGRIEFVILRTGRSPPVALHPLSQERSHLRLQSSNQTLTGTSTLPIRCAHRRTCRRFAAQSYFSIVSYHRFAIPDTRNFKTYKRRIPTPTDISPSLALALALRAIIVVAVNVRDLAINPCGGL
jgi:hypothetical protein